MAVPHGTGTGFSTVLNFFVSFKNHFQIRNIRARGERVEAAPGRLDGMPAHTPSTDASRYTPKNNRLSNRPKTDENINYKIR